MPIKIAVITSTNRPTRVGPKIADWLMAQLPKSKEVTYQLIDIAKEDLPWLDEPNLPAMGNYQNEHTKKWGAKVAGYDGFIWVVAEYNYGYPAPLKNAIDMLYHEWSKKPVAFVGYGSLGAARSVMQLVTVAAQLQMVALAASSNSLRIIDAHGALEENGQVKEGHLRGNIEHMATELIWWAKALKTAREQ
ncbi:MAG: NADPH-dependent reductase [Candidatus Saccharibacteria bacterium]|nr:NADPH-dependent reductase [Candidatus Saccharibacteria bacterium]